MSKALRVVLDTNVVLSALAFAHGRLAPLRQAWQRRRFVPLVSKATTKELVRALAYPKFKLTADEQGELLADYLPYCAAVRPPTRRPTLPTCRDPSDLPFIELALVGKAAYLVSGDRDLLSLGDELNCRVVAPEAFVSLFADSP